MDALTEAVEARHRFVPRTELGRRLADHRERVLDLVRRRGGGRVRVFGSVARGADDAASDIDLMIDIPDDMGLFGLAELEQELSEVLGARVDVVPSRSLRPEVSREALADAVPL
jgi:predicted nucleotidyltransferase